MKRIDKGASPARWWITLAGVGLLALVGCGGDGGATRSADVDFAKVGRMTGFYEAYLSDHRRQPPRDEQAFRDYLQSKQGNLQQAGLTVDEMFVSPRNRGPLVWVYGKKPPTNPMGMMIFAYEQTPTDGKRLVLGSRGMYEEMDEAQFRALFPNVR